MSKNTGTHGGDIFHTIKRKYKNTLKDIQDPHVIKRKARNTVKDVIKTVKAVNDFVSTNKRADGLLPPHVRRFLEKNGDTIITSLQVERTPLSPFMTKLLNTISLGTFENAIANSSYDNMFHLALVINDKYTLDKQEVITLKEKRGGDSKTESINVPLNGKQITIRELLDKTKERMGDSKFSNYDSRTNNCQDFLLNILEANGLSSPSLKDFIKQDAESIYKELPSFTDKIAKFLTDAGATVNKLIEGESVKKKNAWIEFMSSKMKGKKFKSRQEANEYVKQLSKEYKKK